MEFCSVSCGSLNGRVVCGRMDTCICIVESLHYPPETITALLIGDTSIQNKTFKKIKINPLIDLLVKKCIKTKNTQRSFKLFQMSSFLNNMEILISSNQND